MKTKSVMAAQVAAFRLTRYHLPGELAKTMCSVMKPSSMNPLNPSNPSNLSHLSHLSHHIIR